MSATKALLSILVLWMGLTGTRCQDFDCMSPLETGNCRAALQRFGYENGKCTKFTYGGCGGNGNRYRSMAECEAACSSEDRCSLPTDAGNCYALLERWASVDGECKKFTWGGCGGNSNRFVTKEACEAACPPEVTTTENIADVCDLPLRTGPCLALLKKWGHENGSCVEFTYGGCDGNDNNFETKENCEASCPPTTLTPEVSIDTCKLPLKTGPCRALFKKWGYKDGRCQEFTYGGCDGNDNNFETREQCEAACRVRDPCSLPADAGPCEAALRKWAMIDGYCETFVYGGCGGNENRFETREECQATCSPPMDDIIEENAEDVCQLPLKTGRCAALFRKWGYKDDRCQEFVYGGCDGNDNNFGTREECEASCSSIQPATALAPGGSTDICELPLKTGPCRALFKKWGYKDGRCQEFTYGGCDGNDNNFETREQCEAACRVRDPCSLPADAGPCEAALRKWAMINGYCEKFIYGGCGGNENRFETRSQCEKKCNVKKPKPRKCWIADESDVEECKKKRMMTRWFYNPETDRCIRRRQNKCGPNAKRGYRKKSTCEKKCRA